MSAKYAKNKELEVIIEKYSEFLSRLRSKFVPTFGSFNPVMLILALIQLLWHLERFVRKSVNGIVTLLARVPMQCPPSSSSGPGQPG